MLTSNHDALIQILLHQTNLAKLNISQTVKFIIIRFVKTLKLKSQHCTVGKNQGCILVEYIY